MESLLFRENPNVCTCPKSPRLTGGVALDTSSLDAPTLYFSLFEDTYEGHLTSMILVADHLGCTCDVVTTLKDFGYDGCIEMSVDYSHLYCYLADQRLLWMPKSGPVTKDDVKEHFIANVSSLVALDPGSQPMPGECIIFVIFSGSRLFIYRFLECNNKSKSLIVFFFHFIERECLVAQSYSGTPVLLESSETVLRLSLDAPHQNEELCRNQPLPPVTYTVYFAKVSVMEGQSCSNNLKLCQVKVII